MQRETILMNLYKESDMDRKRNFVCLYVYLLLHISIVLYGLNERDK